MLAAVILVIVGVAALRGRVAFAHRNDNATGLPTNFVPAAALEAITERLDGRDPAAGRLPPPACVEHRTLGHRGDRLDEAGRIPDALCGHPARLIAPQDGRKARPVVHFFRSGIRIGRRYPGFDDEIQPHSSSGCSILV